MNLKKIAILAIIAGILYWESMGLLVGIFMVEVDHISTVNHIQDGDTFALESGYWVRLADIDTPERGQIEYSEAGDYLATLIYNKKVYLDVDDVYRYDYQGTGDRLVCVAYVSYNSTHYFNVNQALLEAGYADIYEFYNQFKPFEWQLYTPKINILSATQLHILSITTAIIIAAILYFTYQKLSRIVSNLVRKIRIKTSKYLKTRK